MPRSNHQSTPMDADYFAEEVAFCFDVIESVVVGIMCGDHAGFDPAELASLRDDALELVARCNAALEAGVVLR